MKWQSGYNTGDRRICQRFLVFPMEVGLESRWLEYAKWEEKYHKWHVHSGGFWSKVRWIDD